MTFFNLKPFMLLVLMAFVGCSAAVKDKNEGLSKTELLESVKAQSDDNIEVKSISFDTINDIKEDTSAKANLLGKYYSLKVCVADKRIDKGLHNRTVKLDGKIVRTDASGCVMWEHNIEINHAEVNKCKTFTKTLTLTNGIEKKISYSIDYVKNKVSDLDRGKGCTHDYATVKSILVKKDPIILDSIRLVKGGITSDKRSDAKSFDYTIQSSSCLEVRLTGNDVKEADILVTATNKETGKVSKVVSKTNHKGCYGANIPTSYEQYSYTHWIEYDYKVKVLSGPLAGLETGRSIYINPWETSRALFGYGTEGVVPTVKKDILKENAKFHMDGVMYILIGNDTKKMTVNDYLGLTINKTYQVVLNPYIDYGHRYTDNRAAIKRLQYEGKFKLSILLLAPKSGDMEINKNNFENFEFITGAEKIVTAKNGIVNEIMNIPFKMTDIPRLAVRTISVMKVSPVNDTGLRSSVVTGFFKARIPWIKTNVLQSDALNLPGSVVKKWKQLNKKATDKSLYTLDEIDANCSSDNETEKENTCIEDLESQFKGVLDSKSVAYKEFMNGMFGKLAYGYSEAAKNSPLPITPKQIYVNSLKKQITDLEVMSVRKAKKDRQINIKADDFNKLMPENFMYHGMTKNMIEELCRYAFHKDGAYVDTWYGARKIKYSKCTRNPRKYFTVKSTRHVKKVHGVGESYSNGFILNVGENFSVNESESVATSKYIGMDVGLKPLLEKIPVVGDFLGFKAGFSKNWTNSDAESISESIGTGKGLGIEKFIVEVDASFERCFLVKSKPTIDIKLAAQRAGGTGGNLGVNFGAEIAYMKNGEGMTRDEYFYPKKDFLNVSLYICEDKPKRERYLESWFFVQSFIETSVLRDPDSDSERRVLKVLRGEDNYRILREGLRNITKQSRILDNIGYATPENVLVQAWGHLLPETLTDQEKANFLVHNFEGSYPGTIETSGVKPTEKEKFLSEAQE